MAELSTLARPYAKAAFEYAMEAGDLQGWSDSLGTASSVAKQSTVDQLLSSPSSTSAEQAAALTGICGESLSSAGKNFICILSENRRLKLLPQIAHQFEIMKANQEKAIEVDVASAQPLDEEQQEKLTEALSKKLERKVNMHLELRLKE